MKKIASVILIAVLCTVMLFGCRDIGESKQSSSSLSLNQNVSSPNAIQAKKYHTLLLNVMDNEKTFIAENGSETLFRNYKIPNATEDIAIEVDEYTFIDLDGDNIDELAIKCTTDYGLYIILHLDKNTDNIYGYSLGLRSFIDVKTDGTFMQSSGADINSINKMSFDKTNLKIRALAVNNRSEKIYQIDNGSVTKLEVQKYFERWNSLKNCTWLPFE